MAQQPLCRAISPPTPAPSPQPDADKEHSWNTSHSPDQPQITHTLLQAFSSLSLTQRSKFLNSLLPLLNLNELTNLSARILPRLKRDFLRELPIEISLHILSFVDDPKTLMRAGMVSRFWRSLVSDETTWKGMCSKRGFNNNGTSLASPSVSPSLSGNATTGLGLGHTTTTTTTTTNNNNNNNTLAVTRQSTTHPTDQQLSAPYLTPTPNLGNNNNRTNQLLLPISRRNSFNDLPTSPRLDQFTTTTGNSSAALTPLAGVPNAANLVQRGSPSTASQPPPGQDDSTTIKQPHKVINANSPQPGMMAPTDATSPRRTRPHSMPILGLSLNLTRSISAFADLDNGLSEGTNSREQTEDRLGSSNSQSTSYIPDHPDSAAWTPSSVGPSELPQSAASFYDDFEYSPCTPFSYKSYFKRAYLTESNWLRGPGELVAMQTSQNNDGHEGVVTSLGFDDDWIVVGMATSKIHVFSAHTGEFVRTLTGHELGVWCLALVSKGGVRDPRDPIWEEAKGKQAEPNPQDELPLPDRHPSHTGLFATTEESAPSLANHISPIEWVSSAYYPSSYATNMMRGHGGLGMNTWTRERHGSQDTTVRGHALAPAHVGSIFQPASANMTLEEPAPLPVPVSVPPQEWPNNAHEHQMPPPALQAAAPLPSFSRIPQAPSSASDPTSFSADLRQQQQQQPTGSARLSMQTPVGRPSAPRMTPLGFDYRRARRPSSFSSFMTSHAQSHPDDYNTRSSSHQTQYGSNGTPGGMGLGAGGPSAGNLQQASACGIARGWGQKGSLVVSGGCDRDVRVWDVMTGQCKFVLHGHSSTIRCLKVLDGRPIAVSGSRDSSLRVWDIERGLQKHVLVGHTSSVRAIEVHGNRAVSGSYDTTCRLWDVDTGECLKVLRGHYHQIYAVAFDGMRIASGSMDSTVCIWSASTGELLALLQGHTALVGQVQINGQSNVLVTGGSDGRVVIFSLDSFECVHRLCAHDNSVTCLQFDDRFVVTGGNDGRVKLWDFKTGSFIRELAEPCEAVWRITLRDDKAVLFCKREGKTVMEVISFRPFLSD
ncbi:hypothetical protein PCASD_02538 [Puccinia coronata f. sp. avenae]|uniref:F-box domain-containing protein n=1 Tax=Puccinia coronata f. sp. avenae TaxID=200324 RepID=A0A2N5VBK4_9BASI|nr:hypothetical protein PCASD_02538 [Puccinia coronata f. sp. avenae]